jgi:predicted amidohydrolase YtcJ
MKTVANRIAASDFQLNTHAIGDSANTVILKVYKEALREKKDRRWKIEHAQVIQEADFDYFKLNYSIRSAYTCDFRYVLGRSKVRKSV